MSDLIIASTNLVDNLDIANTQSFADFVALSQQAKNFINLGWSIAEQQMLDRNIGEVKGDWGRVKFIPTEYIKAIKDAKLDDAVVKTVLDTQKAKDFRSLFGQLPEGTYSNTINKFDKRLK